MTNAEAWRAYRKQTSVQVGSKWKHAGLTGVIAEVIDKPPEVWFRIRFENGQVADYGQQQLREVEA